MLAEIVPDGARMRDHWWWRPEWPQGTRQLQWYLTFEGCIPLHRMAMSVQHALAPFPALAPVALPWLHLTLAGFGDAADVTEDCVRDVINAAHQRLAGLPDLTLVFARSVVFAESVVLVPEPHDALDAMQAALEASGRDVLGQDAPGIAVPFAPHVSVAYATGTADGPAVRDALEAIEVEPVTVHPTLSLVEVVREDRQYTWRLVSAFPL